MAPSFFAQKLANIIYFIVVLCAFLLLFEFLE